MRADFVEGLAGFVIGHLRLVTSFSDISKLALSFCSFSDCGVGRASAFFICPNSEDWHHVIFFLRQNQDWQTRLCAPLAHVAVTVAAWQIPWKTHTIQTSKSEKGFAPPAVLQDLSWRRLSLAVRAEFWAELSLLAGLLAGWTFVAGWCATLSWMRKLPPKLTSDLPRSRGNGPFLE
jgi:hypothetical protein